MEEIDFETSTERQFNYCYEFDFKDSKKILNCIKSRKYNIIILSDMIENCLII